MTDVLSSIPDDPVWTALTGPHAHLAEGVGQAVRYQGDVAPFTAIAGHAGAEAWADLRALVGPGAVVVVEGGSVPPPEWEVVEEIPAVQLLGKLTDAVIGVVERRLLKFWA